MKLVEILAKHLKCWPDEVFYIVQDDDSTAKTSKCFSRPVYWSDGIWNRHNGGNDPVLGMNLPLASDHSTAIITSADWEAERARIKGEKVMPKANKDGWIRHRGGRRPVLDNVQVDYRTRDGDIDETGFKAGVLNWGHIGGCADIMAWRPHKAEHEPKAGRLVTEDSVLEFGFTGEGEAQMPAAKYFDGPLQWRDRIHAIDFDKAAAQKTHEAAMAALESERAELVAKLKAEGLALIQAEDSHQEDMSDPLKWKKGDVVVAIDDYEGQFSEGSQYVLRQDYNPELCSVRVEFDDAGSNTNGWGPSHFKWHSRPSN